MLAIRLDGPEYCRNAVRRNVYSSNAINLSSSTNICISEVINSAMYMLQTFRTSSSLRATSSTRRAHVSKKKGETPPKKRGKKTTEKEAFRRGLLWGPGIVSDCMVLLYSQGAPFVLTAVTRGCFSGVVEKRFSHVSSSSS